MPPKAEFDLQELARLAVHGSAKAKILAESALRHARAEWEEAERRDHKISKEQCGDEPSPQSMFDAIGAFSSNNGEEK